MSKDELIQRLYESTKAGQSKDIIRQVAVKMLLSTIDVPEREGLMGTPDRVSRMYQEIFAGYEQQPEKILSAVFSADQHREMVVVKDIPFYSHCEHHMVPFFGVVHIGYVPAGSVVGLSKLARLVECFAKRLQIQERMTTEIADCIMEILEPQGVGVVVEAEHMCMVMRGVRSVGAKTTTSAIRGIMLDQPQTRAEFFSMINGGSSK